MNTKRLAEIRNEIWVSHGWRDGCALKERKEVIKEWNRMPGWFTFYDAVTKLIEEAEAMLEREKEE